MVLRELLNARVIARCLCVAASLGIADLLADGPLTTRELALAAGADAGSLYRVLRGLAARDIFAETDDGRFELTPLAEPLRSGVPGSVRDLAIMFGTPWHWEAWADLEYAVRTGEAAFVYRHGTDLFGYLETHPDDQKLFNAAMTSRPGMGGDVVVGAYDFSDLETVVDVAGGNGELLAAVLAANPETRGILFDLPGVVATAGDALDRAGVMGRCEIVGGDFFDAVPSGDAFVLRTVVHDWDDEAAARIVRSCRDACPDHGRILLLETVIEPGNRPSFGKTLDLEMLVVTRGGRERTEPEFAQLRSSGGFELTSVRPTSGVIKIIEGRPI